MIPNTGTRRSRAGRRPLARGLALALVAAATVLSAAPARAAEPEQIDAAVRRAVAWIYGRQKPTGQWEDQLVREGAGHQWQGKQGDTFGGYTALCTFALLEAGEKPGDPRIDKAIAFLRKCDMYGVYSVGLRAMVFARLPPTPENKATLQQDANRLVGGMIPRGDAKGLWDYESNRPGGRLNPEGNVDLSISQFGVLGLWSAVRAGATVPPDLWKQFDQVWRSHQKPDGGWPYDGVSGVRATMTAAGVATLLIVQDVLGGAGMGGGSGGGAVAAASGADPHIARGIARLVGMFDEIADSGSYGWYGVERIGTAGGLQFLGKVDWYDLGATTMLSRQNPDGSWEGGRPAGMEPLTETPLAVLFLVHGRAPTLVGKLDYSAAGDGTARAPDWNRRPRDVANLIRYMTAATEQPLNWRAVESTADEDNLLKCPVIAVTGAKELVFTPVERSNLKAYVDGGGLLLATSEARMAAGAAPPASDPFSSSIVRVAKQLYPNYAFRPLPPTSPIFTDQPFKLARWKNPPVAYGLSNGVRELIVLLPVGDYGASWQAYAHATDPMKFELAMDVVQYAVTRKAERITAARLVKPRFVWDPYAAPPTTAPTSAPSAVPTTGATTAPTEAPPGPGTQPSATQQAEARYMAVGRLTVGGNWDPEPWAWRRMSTILANDHNLFVSVVPVAADPVSLAKVRLLHWTGTTAVTLSPAQREALVTFVAGGGTVLVDAAGGSAAFADSAAAELVAAFKSADPAAVGAVLAADDPVYRQPAAKVAKFEYRPFTRNKITGRSDVPRVRGLDRNGRTAVFFSREDLTAGCVGQNTDGIVGYAPATATQIVRNVVLWAARRK